MATTESLVARVRMELGDPGKSFVWKTTATGTGRYELPYSPVDGASLEVFRNTTDVTDHVEVEEHTGVMSFDVPYPTTGSTITAQGTHYRFFTNGELASIVDAAVREHLFNRTDSFGRALTIANMPVVEEYPVALLATVQALYTLATDASFDIDISTPDGVSIPRSERYRQLMQMIEMRKAQYDDLCKALNIGLTRIEVFTMRRISRATNRYVPIYMPQEVDDRSVPQRINLPIPTYGGTPVPSKAAAYDLVFTQGDSFSAVLDFPFDLSTYVAKAQVRLYPESQVKVAEIACTVVDAAQGKLRVSLTSDQTKKMPVRAYWDLQLSLASDPSVVETYLRGQVFVARQSTVTGT